MGFETEILSVMHRTLEAGAMPPPLIIGADEEDKPRIMVTPDIGDPEAFAELAATTAKVISSLGLPTVIMTFAAALTHNESIPAIEDPQSTRGILIFSVGRQGWDIHRTGWIIPYSIKDDGSTAVSDAQGIHDIKAHGTLIDMVEYGLRRPGPMRPEDILGWIISEAKRGHQVAFT